MSLEDFMQTFGEDDPVTAHNLRCEMIARAIKAIGDSTKDGDCWRYPKVNSGGYGVTSVLHKSRVTSRLVLCCDTGQPYDYHNEAGEYMIASHRTPMVCRFRDCLNPEHVFWETFSEGMQRREDEQRARTAAGELAVALAQSTSKHSQS